MNHIFVAGRLGNAPEIRYTANGQKVTSFRLATNSKRSGKEETIWWKVTIWGDQMDKMVSYLKKGSAIIVIGELAKPEIFNDREGRPQVSLNIIASSLSFSPFGRTDKPSQDETAKSRSDISQEHFVGSGPSPFGQSGSQDGIVEDQSELALADDEIPF
jgi:single-strand DNA-binding protein